MTYERLTQTILNLIDVPLADFDADESLIDYGLDSFRVFELVGQWQEEGIHLDFISLAQDPSLNGWWRLIQAQLGQNA